MNKKNDIKLFYKFILKKKLYNKETIDKQIKLYTWNFITQYYFPLLFYFYFVFVLNYVKILETKIKKKLEHKTKLFH